MFFIYMANIAISFVSSKNIYRKIKSLTYIIKSNENKKNLKYAVEEIYNNVDDDIKKLIFFYGNYNDFLSGNDNCYNLYNDYDAILKMVNERPVFRIG